MGIGAASDPAVEAWRSVRRFLSYKVVLFMTTHGATSLVSRFERGRLLHDTRGGLSGVSRFKLERSSDERRALSSNSDA